MFVHSLPPTVLISKVHKVYIPIFLLADDLANDLIKVLIII